ncbi:leucyl aminopeptidase family protein [Corynebacterium sp. zg254]|uniref:Probable cytosol aminopeptidase n=1 Tax=Corynebacterium zhongnanshanii TaxID=2768834 RepID=A0ABQ6VFU1_9CORY|nr:MULTISPECIES: M17 family metallopeptidase [Corynebacterium]KAB3523178.1 leucyl aminopeptidase family protein [Corynebacterium zhongnanshanii]MCR5913714.1 leucyl aminopeptidase family protein [Corynebacterium sp. zg254]
MSALPRIPQPTVTIAVGDAVEGNEVISARIVVDDCVGTVELRPGQAGQSVEWVTGVPTDPTPDHDLTDSAEFFDDGWRAAGGSLVRRISTQIDGHPVRAKKHLVQVRVPDVATATNVQSLVIGLVVGNHTLVTSHTKKARVQAVNIVFEHTDPSRVQALSEAAAHGERLAQATCLARDLSNTPSNIKTPEWLANKALTAVEDIPGVKVRVRDKAWLKSKGFGGILAVGAGSKHKPALVEMEWNPDRVGQRRRRKSVLLVGKGVTFDTGGISLKPAAGMGSMRTDMTGGASVLAAFRALAQMQVPRRVVALIPMAENMVDGKSYRPGDVVEHYGGITTEVSNTDAEGRMLLADAVAYGTKKYKPSTVVTLATLTGAAKLALGLRVGAVFAPNWGKGVKLARRGAVVGERWWPMPMLEYLEDAVDSTVADVHQTPKGPGAVTAAMFLRRFTRGVPFYHLDIAGPGRAESTFDEITPLGTGFGARTLINWLSR